MPSDHVGDEALAVEHAVSTLINLIFVYSTSLLTALMEDLYIYKEIHVPAHHTSRTVIFQRHKKNLW